VRRPLHWGVAAQLLALLDQAWAELDARVPPTTPETTKPVAGLTGDGLRSDASEGVRDDSRAPVLG